LRKLKGKAKSTLLNALNKPTSSEQDDIDLPVRGSETGSHLPSSNLWIEITSPL
jgi:hypothetical protein